jgi:hypothetical protein
MKTSKIILTLGCVLIAIACKKSNHPSPSTLSLIQHKWMLVSHNGEALRYVGTANDYYDFNTDNKLYRFVDSVRDTSAYTLSADSKTVSLYPISNGVQSASPMNYSIKTITQNQFIISYASSPIYVLDSLKR